MNVTYGRQNTQIGQVQEFAIQLDESLIFRFLDNAIIIQDDNQNPQMKFIIDGGLLKYQLWDGSQYLPPQSITNPGVSSEDSTTLPHNPANTYLSIDQNGLRVFINLIESLVYFNQELSVQMQTFRVDNQLGDFELRLKTLLGQNFYIKDYDSGANVLQIGSTLINTYNKQLKNLANATEPQDAVTLAQLESLVSNTLQVKLPDTQIHLQNSIGTDLVNVDNSRLLSSVVMSYNAHPTMSNSLYVPDWQNVLDALVSYQQLSQKDQPSGYAGLNGLGQLSESAQRPETCRIDNNMLESYGNQTVTTDYVTEGISNQYFRTQRVLDVLEGQKGVVNGVASLDSSGLVPSSQLPTLQVGVTYSGFDVDKTNPAHYPGLTPVVGDRYISTDLQIEEVLTALPYTFAGNWIQLTTGGVLSVNTFTGAVSLSTDDIPEGADKYFQSGIADYKLNNANQANELVKLNGSSTISTQIIPSTLRVKNGSMQLVDNESNQIDIQNAQNNASVLNVQRTQVVASVPLVNNGVPIVSASQFADKAYVDALVNANEPATIRTNNTSITTASSQITTEVNNLPVRVDEEAKTTLNTPVLYNTLVPVTADQQLATKKYVDDVLSAFIANSGVSKEFLQALSQTSINADGRITGWGINVQSQTKSRIDVGPNDTFNVIAGIYRFYIGIKIREFKDDGLMNVAVIVRDSNTLQEYMLFDFRTVVDSAGGNQEFTMTQPYLWKLDNNANIEVYAQIGETTYNIYESYVLIEEVEKYGVELGRDRITDPTLATTVLTTNQYVDFNINNVDYGKMQNNYLSLTPGIKVKYDPSTAVSQATDLATKQYVDQSVLNSVTAITDLGQMFQAALSVNQTTVLTGGNPVRFDTIVLNSSTTMTMNTAGKITFVHGFIYQISYSIAIQFSASSGFAILSFKNFDTLVSVPGSKLYIVTQPSSNTQQTSITFFVDLRTEVAPQSFTLNVDSSLNLGTVYSQYTRLTCEQKQIVTSQLWDRIQSQSTDTRVRVFNEGIEHFIDGQSLETITNDSSNINRQLNTANAQILHKSTTDSSQIVDATINTNTDNTNQRQSMIVTDINSEVSSVMTSIVTDNGSGNEKLVIFGGVNADKVGICSSNPLSPEIMINSPSMALNIPVQFSSKTGYSSGVVIDQADQFATKQYVDNNITPGMPTGALLMWPTSSAPTGFLLCNGATFSSVTYPALFAVLGSTTLPDFRGKFPRGHDPTNIYDPDTRSLLSTQQDAYENHLHQVTTQTFQTADGGAHQHTDVGMRDGEGTGAGPAQGSTSTGTRDFTVNSTNSEHRHSITIPTKNTDLSTTGSSESRPVNIAINYIIKT